MLLFQNFNQYQYQTQTYLDCKIFFIDNTNASHPYFVYMGGKQISRPHTFKFKLLLTAAVEKEKPPHPKHETLIIVSRPRFLSMPFLSQNYQCPINSLLTIFRIFCSTKNLPEKFVRFFSKYIFFSFFILTYF